MSKRNVMTLVDRIGREVPELSFAACYEANDERLLGSMRMYRNRAFVYVLTIDVEDRESVVYVGQSMSQYNRMLQHLTNYAFSRVYLFDCDEVALKECEAKTICLLMPLFNRHHNPKACRYQRVLDIDYDAVQDEETTLGYLQMWKEYCTFGLYGFALPPVLYSILKKESAQHNRTVSEEVVDILEAVFAEEIHPALKDTEEIPRTNLVGTHEYGAIHGRSCEQVKQYLHQEDRLTGYKIGRDWVVIDDSAFPRDRRERTTFY